MHAIMNGKHVLKYFPGTHTVSPEQVDAMIERVLLHWETHQYGLWAVCVRESGQLIGRCGLQYLPETDETEVGYFYAPEFWGQGIATEAGLASMRFGFGTANLDRIIGLTHPENIASQRVLRKLGMQF